MTISQQTGNLGTPGLGFVAKNTAHLARSVFALVIELKYGNRIQCHYDHLQSDTGHGYHQRHPKRDPLGVR